MCDIVTKHRGSVGTGCSFYAPCQKFLPLPPKLCTPTGEPLAPECHWHKKAAMREHSGVESNSKMAVN
ncbi:hypothetical protein DM784_11410 [Vibrio furnissii]|nr:hypothetical protein DM784_11410 [Vibrio furnissii]